MFSTCAICGLEIRPFMPKSTTEWVHLEPAEHLAVP